VDAVRRTRSIAEGERRGGRKRISRPGLIVATAVLALVASACSSSPKATPSTSATTATAPAGTTPPGEDTSTGVTSTSVTVGQVDDLTAPLPGLFKGAEDGTQAYFDYVNSTGRSERAQDRARRPGQRPTTTAPWPTPPPPRSPSDFALVGGFSLDDSAEEPLIKAAGMPDIAYPLDPDLARTSRRPTARSRTTTTTVPVTIFKLLKKKFPQAIKHVGIIWANDTPATAEAEKAFEKGAESQGFKIVYDIGFAPSQTTFLANVLTMKAKGVQMFFTQQLPDAYAATVAEEMEQQNYHPINIEGDAYSSNLVKDGGSAVNDMYIEIGYLLYLGQDANEPAVKLYTKWMKIADPSANFELQSLFGWASAQLFVEGLRNAGNPPTRSGLEEALDKITSFNARGGNPAQPTSPEQCVVLAQVVNGQTSSGCRPRPGPASTACRTHSSLLPDSSQRSGRCPRQGRCASRCASGCPCALAREGVDGFLGPDVGDEG
jgi:ABC-type branched-subunit amino acid transport system substrate-binding protein